MRYLSVFILLFFIFQISFAQDKDSIVVEPQVLDTEEIIDEAIEPLTRLPSSSSPKKNNKPLVIVNGEKKNYRYVKKLDVDLIESIIVVKGEKALEKYGDKGKYGVIEIITKNKKNEGKSGIPEIDKLRTYPSVDTSFINTDSTSNDIPVGKVEDLLNGKTSSLKITPANKLPGSNRDYAPAEPLYVVDVVVRNANFVNQINPDSIQSIFVLKDEKALDKYGERGKNGVIEIYTKAFKGRPSTAVLLIPRSIIKSTNDKTPIYVVEGLQVESNIVNQIDPNHIKKIVILKDESTAAFCGEIGKNGVVVITLKKKYAKEFKKKMEKENN